MNNRWSEVQENYLQDKWGTTSISYIALKVGKSVNAVKLKAYKLGLRRHLHSGTEITINQLFKAIGKSGSYSWTLGMWVKQGFPLKYKKSIKTKFKVVDIEEFWAWAEKNKGIIDFSKFEKDMLGKEPDWVDEKRAADIKATKYKKTPWTKKEDQYLKSLLNSYRHGYKEISQILNRTDGAIIRRMNDLGLKQRPLRADNHTKWTEKETSLLVDMLSKGYAPQVIAENLPLRSIKAVQGKIERMMKTG